MKQRIHAFVFLLLSTAVAAPCAPSAEVSREYAIKAAFLINFAKYVSWPDGVFSTPTSPIVIGILGQNPFGAVLDKIVLKKTVGERSFTIARFPAVEDITPCQILFVNTVDPDALKGILERVQKQHTLIVADSRESHGPDGHIYYTLVKNKVRFVIDLKATERSNLKVRSEILKVAHKVIK